MRDGRAIVLAVPGCVLSAGLALALVGALVGRHPVWPDHGLTLSEAVVTRAVADVVGLIRDGRDPNAPYDVRPGLLDDDAVRVTPLEAAVLSRDSEMIERLLGYGAQMGPAAWMRLRCLAGDDAAMRAVLEPRRPPGAGIACGEIGAP